MRRGTWFAVVACAALAGFTVLAITMSERGDAAFPGTNGRIAYAYGDGYSGAIWSVNADGSVPSPLTNGAHDYNPFYSADGSRVGFSREEGIFVMNADGSGLTQLLPGSRSSSSDTRWIENYETPQKEIIPVVKIQTFSTTWRSFGGGGFSPDGTQIVVSESAGKSTYGDVCAVETSGEQECIPSFEPESYFREISECNGCFSHIVTANSTTGALTGEVTPQSSGWEDYAPTYSASGAIAFSRWASGSGSAIFIVSSVGAPAAQVTAGPSDYSPDFSPDGTKIVFTHADRELGVVGVGGGPVTLFPIVAAPSPTTGSGWVEGPVFSPDGTKIAFQRVLNPPGPGKSERAVFLIGAEGAGLTKLVEGASNPSWQPIPIPPPVPAASKTRKGKVKLDRKGKATIGTIVCGSSPCTLKVLSSKLKAGKKPCSVKTTLAKKLAPGKSTKVGVKVAGKCLAALQKAGKGRLTAKVGVTEALGKKVLTFKSTLIPPKAKKAKNGKK
jgi:Tol biopolymer transport system component